MKIFLDVSALAGWQHGSPSGVQRVEYHLVKYYLDNPAGRLMIWSDEQRSFIGLSKATARQILKRMSQSQPSEVGQYRAALLTCNLYGNKDMTQTVTASRLKPGATVWIEVRLRNTGQRTWWQQDTHLRLVKVKQQATNIYHKRWISETTPGQLDQTYVLEGETGRFIFPITVPDRPCRVFERFFDITTNESSQTILLTRVRLIIGTQIYSSVDTSMNKLLAIPFLIKECLGNRWAMIKQAYARQDGFIDTTKRVGTIIARRLIRPLPFRRSLGRYGQLCQTTIKSKLNNDNNPDRQLNIGRSDIIFIPSGFWSNQIYVSHLQSLATQHTLIHTVHDIFPFVCPALVKDSILNPFREYAKRILPVMDHIVSISDNTSRDIHQLFKNWKLSPPSILDFRLGSDLPSVQPKRPAGICRSGSKEFILAVSTVEPRKNYELLLQVYELAKERQETLPHLYIAGRIDQEWQINRLLIRRALNDSYLAEHVTILGQVTDEELVYLYQNAKLTVFPSFYEGWGIPVAESLAYGKVTLCAATSAVTEVGGQLADYFSPHSPESLLRLMTKYQDSKQLKTKQTKIREDYTPIEWAKAVDKFHNKLIRLKDA